jgi:hypothetical protein
VSTHTLRRYAVLDAARGYTSVAVAGAVCRLHGSLFEGEAGRALDSVAPHLFLCDQHALVCQLVVAAKPDEVGILLDTPLDLRELRRHLRRFLRVRRQSDGRVVFFRYFDPRVLRAFLPACTAAELAAFFGPITAFHCQADAPGSVRSFWLEDGALNSAEAPAATFLAGALGAGEEAPAVP